MSAGGKSIDNPYIESKINFITSLNDAVMDGQEQTSGAVTYQHLGVRFVIPDGWVGRETPAGYLISSPTEPGIALLNTSGAKSIGQLQNLAYQGIRDENGTTLTLSGVLERVAGSGIGGEFEGFLEGNPVKAYMAGLVNPQGSTVLILSAASPDQYTAMHKKLAISLAESMQFTAAEVPPLVLEWRKKLKNARLTHMDSYYSNDGGADMGGVVFSSGGGFSNRVEIHLSQQGRFKYKKSSSASIDMGSAYGGAGGSGEGDGTWEVVPGAHGQAFLHLHFSNGDEREYLLEYRDNKTWLNNIHYFLTYE